MDHNYFMPSTSNYNAGGESKNDKDYLHLHGNELAQKFVCNIYNYFQKWHPQINAVQETAKALKISDFSVRKYKDGPTENRLVASRKKHKPLTEDLRQSARLGIRDEIYTMYAEKKPVNLQSLHTRIRQKNVYSGGKESLRKVIKSLGFMYKKDDNRRALMEKPDVAAKRRRFLEAYMRNENLGSDKKPYVFLDETWIFSNGSLRKSWQDSNIKSVRKETGEGYRYIILHAGGKDGFIENARLIFKSKSKTGDYHGEMNSDNFEKWLSESLLPNLEEPSILLLDNASYHSKKLEKRPNKNWLKADMQNWLSKNEIDFLPTETVPELWAKINVVLPKESSYKVDELIYSAGHEVLRLPPYHCQFNAIEMVWSQAKRLYDQYILKEKDVVKAWEMALNGVSKEQWANYVNHTDKTVKAAWEKERHIIVTMQEPIIIQSNDSDTDFSDEISGCQ